MLQGDLTTIPLAKLLDWIGSSRKSGCLLVQQSKRGTRLFFRDGRVVACSSDDPVKLLGQFLLFKGAIDEVTLSRALGLQSETGGALRNILLEMGALTMERLREEVVEKAEETILDLFEWSEATFWFAESIPVDENAMDVSLGVDEIIERGTRRLDERERIRSLFPQLRMVVERTGSRPQLETLEAPTSRLYEAVDGTRTIEELIVHVRGTEYQVTRHLAKLYEDGFLSTRAGEIPPAPGPGTADVHAGPWSHAESPVAAPDQLSPPTSRIPEVAARLSRGDHPGALELLEQAHGERPGEAWIREEIRAVETAFVQKVFMEDFSPSAVPVPARSLGSMTEDRLTSTESFLVGLVRDRRWDVKSLLWISPMRSVDVLLALRHLIELGFVTVEEADSEDRTASA